MPAMAASTWSQAPCRRASSPSPDRVHGGRAGRAHRRDDRARLAAAGDVVAERLLERVGYEGMRVVGRDQPQVLPAEAGEQRGLLDPAVGLVRGVDDERRRRGLEPAAALTVAGVRSRAQSSATSVAVEAVSWMTPLKVAGSPSICRSQSITTSSSSVAAGLVCQLIPWTPRPEVDQVGEHRGEPS